MQRDEFISLFWKECRYDKSTRPREVDSARIGGLFDLVSYAKPNKIIEIGCFRGLSTEVWLRMCTKVVAIDPWPTKPPWQEAQYQLPEEERPLVLEDFLKRLGHYKNLEVVVGESPEALKQFTDFDLCYIDGAHSYDSVIQDIDACRKAIKKGGWIAGHDWVFPQVAQAVTERLGADVLVFDEHQLGDPGASWLVKL